MIYDMNKPSDNMNLSQREIDKMTKDLINEQYNEDIAKEDRIQAQQDRERAMYANYVNEYTIKHNSVNTNRFNFLNSVKEGFLSTAILKLFKESVSYYNKSDITIMKNLVKEFVAEQGAGDLLNRFKYQNTFIAEMGRIVEENYAKVVESVSNKDEDKPNDIDNYSIKLDKTIVDDFYKDLIDLDTVEASKLIKDRVSDAMQEFIDNNMQSRIEYQDIIDTAKEKIQAATEESTIEAIKEQMERNIHEIKRVRPKNVFHHLVEYVTKSIFNNDKLKAQYVHESSVDMDRVVHSAELIYTMLEMVSTTEMVDNAYVENYIKGLLEE